MNIIKKYIPTILFCVILLTVILRDSIKGGFTGGIFLLDFVPTPVYEYKLKLLETSIFWNIYNLGQYIFGYILWSKIYIYGLIIGTLLTGYKIAKYICHKLGTEDELHQNVIYIAGIALMVINPFFTERMATQPTVRNGILFTGLGLYILVANYIKVGSDYDQENNDKKSDNITNIKNIIYIGLLWGFAWGVMNHAIFMIGLVSMAYIIATGFKKKDILKIIYINIIVGLFNINRIIGSIYGANDVIKSATTFNEANISAFATQSLGGLPVEISAALGYGFWAEQGQRLVTADNGNRLWRIFGLIILSIGIYGIYSSLKVQDRKSKVSNIEENNKNIRSDNKIIYISIFLMIATLWLGIGISNHFGADTARWMYEYIPGYRGFREPHKRIGIYMIILIPYIIIGFAKLSKKIDYTILLPIFIFLLYGRAPGIINMGGLYKLTDYPAEYQTSRSYILSKYPDLPNGQASAKWILVPRHSYMGCNRNSNVISITASDFYKPSIVKVADNIEIGSLYTNNSNSVSNQIDNYIYSGQDNNIIKGLGYKGFILWKGCADTGSYQWIDNKNKFDNIYSGNDVGIYIVK